MSKGLGKIQRAILAYLDAHSNDYGLNAHYKLNSYAWVDADNVLHDVYPITDGELLTVSHDEAGIELLVD
jgi:hypothetical protein